MIDFERLGTYKEAMGLYKIKTFADVESFLLRSDIDPREKIETLYIISETYYDVLDYIDERIEKIKGDHNI